MSVLYYSTAQLAGREVEKLFSFLYSGRVDKRVCECVLEAYLEKVHSRFLPGPRYDFTKMRLVFFPFEKPKQFCRTKIVCIVFLSEPA